MGVLVATTLRLLGFTGKTSKPDIQ